MEGRRMKDPIHKWLSNEEVRTILEGDLCPITTTERQDRKTI
jgi:hypothetical protein